MGEPLAKARPTLAAQVVWRPVWSEVTHRTCVRTGIAESLG